MYCHNFSFGQTVNHLLEQATKTRFKWLLFIFLFSFNSQFTGSAAAQSPPKEQPDARWYANEVTSHARNNPTYAIEIADKALYFFSTKPSPTEHAIVLNEKSYALYILARYSDSMALALKAQKFAERHQIEDQVARARVLQGHLLQSVSQFDHALTNYRAALKYYMDEADSENSARVTNSIANVYFSYGEFELALSYYQRLEDYTNSPYILANMMLGSGNSYSELGFPRKAIESFEKAEQYYRQADDMLGQELAYAGLGWEYKILGEFDKAEKYYLLALESAENAGRRLRMVNTLLGIGNVYLFKEKYAEAMALSQQAEALIDGDKGELIDVLTLRRKIFEAQNNSIDALAAIKQVEELRKALHRDEMDARLAVMHAMFELDAANTKIDLLESENQLKQLKIDHQYAVMASIVAAFLVALLLLAFYFYRRNQRKIIEEHKAVAVKLKELDQLKDQVMTNTSHELRTPLNGIIGLSEVILMDYDQSVNEEVKEQIEIIQQCGTRLLNLVEDILDVATIKENRLKLNRKKTDVTDLVTHVVGLLKPMAEEKSLSLGKQIETPLNRVLVDSERIIQVFTNLVKNAIKFSERGEIIIHLSNTENGVLCQVSDQGLGVAEDMQERIFDPFERVTNDSRHHSEGAGLGLAIVKDILELHGTDIKFTSTPGKGSVFYFELSALIPKQSDPVAAIEREVSAQNTAG